MSTESRLQFAKRLGVNKGTVTRWAQAGRLVLAANGRDVDVEASQARLAATQGARSDVAARHAEKRGRALPTAPAAEEKPTEAPELLPAGSGGAADEPLVPDEGRAVHKARALHFENQQIRLELALRRGERYILAGTRREAQGLGGMLRAAFERLIDQTAPRLAVMHSDFERRALINAELRRIRRLFRREQPAILRRLRTSGDDAASALRNEARA